MAKREDDGTISLAEANRQVKEMDRIAREQNDGVARAAHAAIDSAFGNTLGGRRTQKPLRGQA